mmetsp:Transcript_72806/g.152026  ORF Transcript_72806/g.152026 Transcript_72806/m.152026 type:complete len:206 (+) Transcript_72806:2614-3231(+)
MRGGTHRVVLICSDTLELEEGVVPELRRGKQETGLQNAERVRERNGVEVLDLHFVDLVLVVREGDLVEIAVLGLDEEEEEILQLMGRVGNDEKTLLLGHFQSSRDGADDVGVVLLLVDKAIFAANENSTWPVHTAGHSDKGVGGVVDSISESSRDVVETKIHLVHREHLLGRLGIGVSVDLFVAQLDAREERVLETDVHAASGVD